jgi:sugar O-acyltransferase (sialic acid O-acetyltransferase NeuD family)
MILIGYAGHAFVVYNIINASGKKVTGYCDNEEKTHNPFLLKYFGKENTPAAQLALQSEGFFIAIGDNTVRKKISEQLLFKKLFSANIIHPSSLIDSSCNIAPNGIMVAANVVINPLATIGEGVICNTGCIIEHECVIGSFAHIGPGAVLCGNVKIGEGSFVGANAVIRQGIVIGNNVTIGAGSVVVKNVPHNSTVMGVAAQIK